MGNIPVVPKEYYPAMLTVSLVLIVTGLGFTSITNDRLIATVLIGIGIILLFWTIAKWELERYRQKKAERSIKRICLAEI